MTQNLRLINYELKPFDSDVDSNWTLPNTTSGTNQDTAYVYVDNTYGGYYSWTAATAGTGTTSVTLGNAPSSICSRGWRLPTGGDSGEFQNLRNNVYTSAAFGDTWTIFPLSITMSGRRIDSNTTHQGSDGFYWSSTTNGAIAAYYLYLADSMINPTNNNYKFYGFSVRCLAK